MLISYINLDLQLVSKLPKGVRRFLDWSAETSGKANSTNGIGTFYHSEETIAAEMGCSLSTVERAIKWLKRHGLMFVALAWNYSEGRWGSAYKIFADAKTIDIVIKALLAQKEQVIKGVIASVNQHLNTIVKKMTGSMTGSMTGNKRPSIKDQDTKDIKNRLEESDTSQSNQIKNSYKGIPAEIVEITENSPYNKDEKVKVAKKIRNAVKDAGIEEITAEIQGKILQGLRKAIQAQKKGAIKNPNKKYDYIYQCIKTAINGYLTKQETEVINGQKIVNVNHYHMEYQAPKRNNISVASLLEEEYGQGATDDLLGNESKQERVILNDHDVKVSDKKPIRTELLPDWFDKKEEKPKEKTVEEIEKHIANLNSINQTLADLREISLDEYMESNPKAQNDLNKAYEELKEASKVKALATA